MDGVRFHAAREPMAEKERAEDEIDIPFDELAATEAKLKAEGKRIISLAWKPQFYRIKFFRQVDLLTLKQSNLFAEPK